jgi:hypothetical protein
MGNRANYVLIEEGHHQIYFSRWGAPTIPSVLLSGPVATIAFVRALTPDDEILDEVWAEGGMLLDIDNRRLRFFGGVKVASAPYLQRPLLRVLRRLWPGWSVEWALLGIADLALGLGWEIGCVLTTEFDELVVLCGSAPLMRETLSPPHRS